MGVGERAREARENEKEAERESLLGTCLERQRERVYWEPAYIPTAGPGSVIGTATVCESIVVLFHAINLIKR